MPSEEPGRSQFQFWPDNCPPPVLGSMAGFQKLLLHVTDSALDFFHGPHHENIINHILVVRYQLRLENIAHCHQYQLIYSASAQSPRTRPATLGWLRSLSGSAQGPRVPGSVAPPSVAFISLGNNLAVSVGAAKPSRTMGSMAMG